MFLGDESASGSESQLTIDEREGARRSDAPLRYLAAVINVARKTRWRVDSMPCATLGRRARRRSR